MSIHGHFWTLRQHLRGFLEPALHEPILPFEQIAITPGGARVTVRGAWLPQSQSELLIVLHGLGGSIDSRYMLRAARAAITSGVSCLLLNARGAGAAPTGVAHAGLTEDLELVLQSELLAGFRNVYLLGYSLGGHVALRYGSMTPDARVRSIAAICSPLDLRSSVKAFDAPRLSVYRQHVISGLIKALERSAQARDLPLKLHELRRISKIFDWDQHVVVPCFGFASAFDYYERMSVAACLSELSVPSLWLGTHDDPMVARRTVQPVLDQYSSYLDSHWSRIGGHVALPADFSLGFATSLGLEPQCLAWLRQHAKNA